MDYILVHSKIDVSIKLKTKNIASRKINLEISSFKSTYHWYM